MSYVLLAQVSGKTLNSLFLATNILSIDKLKTYILHIGIHNSQYNQKILYPVQTNTAISYGHSREEKSKLELEEKKLVYY